MVWYNNNQWGVGTVGGGLLGNLKIVVFLVKHCYMFM